MFGFVNKNIFRHLKLEIASANKATKQSKLEVSVYHVNTQEGSPSHFSNKSYTIIIIFADNQFVHVIISNIMRQRLAALG